MTVVGSPSGCPSFSSSVRVEGVGTRLSSGINTQDVNPDQTIIVRPCVSDCKVGSQARPCCNCDLNNNHPVCRQCSEERLKISLSLLLQWPLINRGQRVSLLFSLFILSSVSSSPRSSGVFLPSDSDKVSLDFYYESLCPFCARFITKFLVKLFDSDLISIVDLHLSPWGNAKIRGNSTFDCQHGPSECLLNTVEACAIDAWPELNEHFPFIYCVESLMVEGKHTEWKSCFEKLGLDPKPILDCYDSEYGKKVRFSALT
ncbi:GILT-like protein 3 [Carica papaya]|uniref:GILT-like protein 3 n=1 Tax=Carica papaya TaxID=3649 RepID=UPI000B8CDB98|nr:GILT-like protein 3 [Carica papaya]